VQTRQGRRAGREVQEDLPVDGDRFRNCRVLVDAVANYWTVVLECEFESLSDFEHHLAEYGRRDDVREAMAGYMDLVEGGRREIFRIV
jgi:hypothetical protein